MQLKQRLQKLQSSLSDHQGLLLSRPTDIQYLTGFKVITLHEREAFLVLTNSTAVLLYPSFSPVEMHPHITYHSGHWLSDVQTIIQNLNKDKKNAVTEWLVDLSALYANEYAYLLAIPNTSWQAFNREQLWEQRQVKDFTELSSFRNATQITEEALEIVRATMRAGMSEIAVATEFEYTAKKLGASSLAFPPVIAFGSHSALPHHQPTTATLDENQVVLMDVGAAVDGYCADMTRTIWFGDKPSRLFVEIKDIVDQAYTLAADVVKNGAVAGSVDDTARKFITSAGYCTHFIHSTGHGVGLEIHEPPSLSTASTQILKRNMIVTVEPGIYLEGKFGYRYENSLVVE